MANRISWVTLTKGTRVLGTDGDEVGQVGDVVADRQKDIFSGITVSEGILSTSRFVPADLIDQMTTDAVHLSIAAADAEEKLEPYG